MVALSSSAAYGPVAFLPLLCCHKTRTRCGQPLLVLPFHGITTSEKEKKRCGVQHLVALVDRSAPPIFFNLFPRFRLLRRPIESVCRLAVCAWDPGSLTSHDAFSSARGSSIITTPIRQQHWWYVLGQLGSPLALLAKEWSGMVLGGSSTLPPTCDPTGGPCGGWQFACRSTLAVQSSVSSGVG